MIIATESTSLYLILVYVSLQPSCDGSHLATRPQPVSPYQQEFLKLVGPTPDMLYR